MNQLSKNSAIWLFILRITTGWLMFYAGIVKIIDPSWSAKGYLTHALTFPSFYNWFAQQGILEVTNFINEWGLTILGLSLLLGAAVRATSIFGAILMILYYFPAVKFPFTQHSFIIEEHIIYAAILLFLAAIRAGRYYGLDKWCAQLPVCQRYPKIHKFFG